MAREIEKTEADILMLEAKWRPVVEAEYAGKCISQ